MFLTMMERHSSHVLDSGALDIVPDDARQALIPDPVDEGAHEPGMSRCGTRAGTGTSPTQAESAAGSGWG